MSPTLREEVEAKRRAAIQPGTRVIVRRPFTEERAEGVVIERLRDMVLVACGGEEIEYQVSEVEKAV